MGIYSANVCKRALHTFSQHLRLLMVRLGKKFPVGVCWALPLTLTLVACGGGGGDAAEPAQYPTQVISGTVTQNGAALANTQVFGMCSDGFGGMRKHSTVTDGSGVYRKSVDTSVAPCVLQVDLNAQNRMYSYVRALTSEVTANVTPLTDAVLSLTLDTAGIGDITVVNTISNTEYLRSLRSLLDAKVDDAKWQTLREQLKTSTIFSDPTNVEAMQGDPVSAPIQVPTAGVMASAGYVSMLQNMASKNIASLQLQALVTGERFRLVAGSNGSEVEDVFNGLVWQRCVVGMVWTGSECQGTPSKLLFADIAALVASHPPSSDPTAKPWRVPTVGRLQYIWIYDTKLGGKWFPSTPAGYFWSSSKPAAPYTAYPARVINMATTGTRAGTISIGENTDTLYLQLVR